jgi:hypothetical protein
MSETNYTVFNAMTDIFASPGKALDEVKSKTSWLWWPLIINTALASVLFIYYFSWVDFPWLIEETIRNLPADSRAESADAVRKFMSPGTSTWTTVAAIVIMSFVIYLLLAVYFHLANKVTSGSDIGFGQWFSFSVWTGFISVFGSLAVFVLIMMADNNQLAQTDLQPLSFNTLLIHAAPGDPWFTWASSLSLINVWWWFLMSIGYSAWTDSPIVKSTIIVLLPWIAIFGIWAAMI